MHLLVVAKRPLAGLAKTRLIPRFGAEGAAALAAAALADTFAAAHACRADRVVVSFDGDPTGVVPNDFEVFPQCAGDLADRLTGAWSDAGGPGVQIGMDTPQLTAADLDAALDALRAPGVDSVLGPASDGGWWSIGFHHPHPDAFAGIPMSQPHTGARQQARLQDLGLTTSLLPTHPDVDLPDDVARVAALAPGSRFAEVADRLLRRTAAGGDVHATAPHDVATVSADPCGARSVAAG